MTFCNEYFVSTSKVPEKVVIEAMSLKAMEIKPF
jgi:hypothetical protein